MSQQPPAKTQQELLDDLYEAYQTPSSTKPSTEAQWARGSPVGISGAAVCTTNF
jgi:hypothetical protein